MTLFFRTVFAVGCLISGLQLHAQSSKQVLAVNGYIGSFNGREVFISGALNEFGVEKLVTVTNESTDILFVIPTDKNEKYAKWLVYENRLFAVITGDLGMRSIIQLAEFDKNFNVVSKAVLNPESSVSSKLSAYASVDKGVIGIIAVPANKEENSVACVVNLQTDEKFSREFACGNLDRVGCKNIITNSKNELFAVLESDKVWSLDQRLFSSKPESFLVAANKNKVEVNSINANTQAEFIKGFRLCKISETAAVLGALSHERSSGNMCGYFSANLTFGGSSSVPGTLIPAYGIDNPEFWVSGEVRKVTSGTSFQYLHNQLLKEIVLLPGGDVAFISESHLAKNGSDSYGDMGFTFTFVEDFIVAEINPQESQLKWISKPKYRCESADITPIHEAHYNYFAGNGFLTILYGSSASQFTDAGEFLDKRPVREKDCVIAQFSIDTKTGFSNNSILTTDHPKQRISAQNSHVKDGKLFATIYSRGIKYDYSLEIIDL